jgi:hypothetical protein
MVKKKVYNKEIEVRKRDYEEAFWGTVFALFGFGVIGLMTYFKIEGSTIAGIFGTAMFVIGIIGVCFIGQGLEGKRYNVRARDIDKEC